MEEVEEIVADIGGQSRSADIVDNFVCNDVVDDIVDHVGCNIVDGLSCKESKMMLDTDDMGIDVVDYDTSALNCCQLLDEAGGSGTAETVHNPEM